MSRAVKSLLVAIFFVLSATAAFAQKAEIIVKQTSEVKAADITLGKIASLKSRDKAIVEKLSGALVCRSPLPGRSFRVYKSQIISAIRRASVTEDASKLVCPDEVTVSRTSATVSGQMLFDAAQNYILDHSSWTGTVSVENVRTPLDQSVPEGTIELRVNPTGRKLIKGRNSIDVDMVVDDTVYARTQLPVFIRISAPVLVATKAIGRLESISTDNTVIQEQDITGMSDDIVTTAPDTDVIAALPISQGAVVRKNCITTPFTICSGDAVTVLVTSGKVSVAEKGVAQSNGRKSDWITIKLSGADRVIKGTVIEPGFAKIMLGGRN